MIQSLQTLVAKDHGDSKRLVAGYLSEYGHKNGDNLEAWGRPDNYALYITHPSGGKIAYDWSTFAWDNNDPQRTSDLANLPVLDIFKPSAPLNLAIPSTPPKHALRPADEPLELQSHPDRDSTLYFSQGPYDPREFLALASHRPAGGLVPRRREVFLFCCQEKGHGGSPVRRYGLEQLLLRAQRGWGRDSAKSRNCQRRSDLGTGKMGDDEAFIFLVEAIIAVVDQQLWKAISEQYFRSADVNKEQGSALVKFLFLQRR